MKLFKILFLSLFVFTGCAQLMNGQQQPVVEKNFKDRIYFTTCSGSVEDWGSCARKAKLTCANGYDILKRSESMVGGRREITFQCNK